MRTPPEVMGQPKAKATTRAKTKDKIVAEPVAKPVVEQVAELVVVPDKKETRKPKQPKPVTQDPAALPDIEDLIMKSMKTMRDEKEIEIKDNNQGHIAQAT